MLPEIKKDITTVTKGVVCHGVNCRRAMGSGVALAIKTQWPDVYKTYMSSGQGPDMLGNTVVLQVTPQVFVANCYTQLDFKGYHRFVLKDDETEDILAQPEAISTSMRYAFTQAKSFGLPLYLPKIGSGLGGLEWARDVYPIIDVLTNIDFPDVDTTICIWP